MAMTGDDRRRGWAHSRDGSSSRGRFVIGIVLWTVMFLAYDGFSADPVPSDTTAEQRQTRMNSLFENVTLTIGTEIPRTATRSPQPVLKYTNPVNSSQLYASMFLWFDDTIPVAVVCPSFRDSGKIFWEWTSLTPQPMVLTRDGKKEWQPRTAGHTPVELPNSLDPAGTAPARLTQMRAMARRFGVSEERRGSQHEARLLSQPLYRWEYKAGGVIDAALFGFTETTDPELLLRLEAWQITGSDERRWFYSLARMTSSPISVTLDEQTVWSAEGFWRNPRTPQDPYIEATIGQFDPKTFFPNAPAP